MTDFEKLPFCSGGNLQNEHHKIKKKKKKKKKKILTKTVVWLLVVYSIFFCLPYWFLPSIFLSEIDACKTQYSYIHIHIYWKRGTLKTIPIHRFPLREWKKKFEWLRHIIIYIVFEYCEHQNHTCTLIWFQQIIKFCIKIFQIKSYDITPLNKILSE